MDNDEKKKADDAAIAAMRNAKKHMESSLERIDLLEKALQRAGDNLERCKKFVPDYVYQRNTDKSIREQIASWVEDARYPL